MSLACKPNKPTPSYPAIRLQQTNRDIGLSPIFNVNTEVISCVEAFTGPTYPCGNGMCETVTGLTISCPSGYTLSTNSEYCYLTSMSATTASTLTVVPSCLHNLSEVDDFDITFDFTSGSTMYTGYTGAFCYTLQNSLPAINLGFTCVDFSGITGNSITRNLDTTVISSVDNSYLVRSWNKFTSKCMTDFSGSTGITIDTLPYIDFDDNCHFVTVTNPPKPILELQPVNALEGITFINETVMVQEGSSEFLLAASPIGSKVLLSVNGITLSNVDYTVDPVDSRLITINGGVTFEARDLVSASYNMTNGGTSGVNTESVKLEFFSVTGITTGVTSSVSATTYSNFVNNNVVNNRLEIFLEEKIDPGVEPRLTINGVNLAYNVDFFKSNLVQNKLILNEGTVIEIEDKIAAYYYFTGINNPGDLGVLKTNTPTIAWTTQQNILRTDLSSGSFIVDITNRNDPSFSNVLYTGTSIYNNLVSSYTLDMGPIITSFSDYIYRITFIKNFVTIEPRNIYTTQVYSDIGSLRLDKSYLSNRNF